MAPPTGGRGAALAASQALAAGPGAKVGRTPGQGGEGERSEILWKEEETNRAPENSIGLKSFSAVASPLRAELGLACFCFWKVGTSHIPGRFSRHLTRRGGGGGGGRGRGARRHHPPRRTHSRACRVSEAAARATTRRPDLGARAGGGDASFKEEAAGAGAVVAYRPAAPFLPAGTKYFQLPEEKKPSPQARERWVV